MKLAVLSDIHGNLPALEAVLDDIVRWQPDLTLMNGDLVSRGPYSLACLRLLQQRLPDCRYLNGNHESYVLACADNAPRPDDPTWDIGRFAVWTHRQMGDAVEELRTWEDAADLGEPGTPSACHVTHASRASNRSGISAETPDEVVQARIGEPPALFVCGHTHRALIRRHGATLVVNTGAVGQPFDGDARAAWGRFTLTQGAWHAEIARVAFDKPRADRDFEESGFLDQCGPIAHLIHREFRECRPLVGRMMGQYLDAIRQSELTVEEAVRRFEGSL